jgi:hypothetical protein
LRFEEIDNGGGSVGKLHVDKSGQFYFKHLIKLLKIRGECPALSWKLVEWGKCVKHRRITGFWDFVHRLVL